MTFEWLAFQDIPHLNLDLGLRGYLAVLVFVVATAVLSWRCYGSFGRLPRARWVLLAATILVTPLFSQALILSFEPAGWLRPLSIPLLGLIPILVAAVWLGEGPAMLVGLSTGLTWALFGTSRLSQPFEVAILGYAVAALVGQLYQGRLMSWLRRPFVALLLAVLVIGWPLQVAGTFLLDPSTMLAGLDRTLAGLLPSLLAASAAACIAGLLAEGVLTIWPRLHPAHGKDLQVAPWEIHLSQRLSYILVPLALLAAAALMATVMAASYQVSTRLVVDQVARDATNVANDVPAFFQTGRSLLRQVTESETLHSDDAQVRHDGLKESWDSTPFFEQLLYFDASGQLLDSYPELAPADAALTPAEADQLQLVLSGSLPEEITAIKRDIVTITFVSVVSEPAASEPAGVLLGRTALADNPAFFPVASQLRGKFIASSEGLIIDEQNRIVYYPAHSELRGETFTLDTAAELSGENGKAFRQMEADGTRRLVYLLPITGQPQWSVVMLIPNQAALALAGQIVMPTFWLIVLIALVLVAVHTSLVRQVTVPLNNLLQAVDQIAEGRLDHSIQSVGEDEAGRLGRAFEAMRIGLKNRLDEQERLLRVSRGVSGNLELFRAMPIILNSALEVAQARGVRIVLRLGAHDPLQTYTVGEAATAMAALDAQLIALVEQEGTVVISQVWRASGSLDISRLPPYIRAIVALPLRSENSFHGILWLGYDHEHVFEQSEMTFLSTLSSQAAIAVSNARLFTETEEGRRKLEAVLTSTADGMIVTDNQGRIVLVNPAAEGYFGIRGDLARGRKATEILDVPDLAALLTNLEEPVASLEFPDGRNKILLANTSTIVSHDGTITGRVAILRDITALKELDSIKTVFLRMVSHDLRSPLTYMRGYLSMLPMIGELNQKQQDSIGKIQSGIEHISEMTERLLYLSRLKFGEEAELEFSLIDVKDMIAEIVQEQSRMAQEKHIDLRVEADDKLPLLLADAMLYRQAVMNLINNALKCTPENGEVVVRAFQEDEEHITTSITDNGIGIREEDQPRLFEAFYRVPFREDDPPRPRGTGLGLVLVKTIAEVHEGTVGVVSDFGKGSTFHITFPLRKAEDL
jgi:PAS domain S-box-containing protein